MDENGCIVQPGAAIVISTVPLPSQMVYVDWSSHTALMVAHRLNRGVVDCQIGDDPVLEGLVNREPVDSSLVFVCVLRCILRQAGVIMMKNPYDTWTKMILTGQSLLEGHSELLSCKQWHDKEEYQFT